MKTYIITNDRYSQNDDEMTFDELMEMCQALGWNTDLEEASNDTIIETETGEIVGEAK